jgi:AraC family transcriptional regulator of adaptative response / DNA-3-methyladenine glycosylase II
VTTQGRDPLTIAVRLPFHAMGLLAYLGARAMPGVEEIAGMTYRRVVSRLGRAGILSVDLSSAQRGRIEVCCDLPRSQIWAAEKVHALLDADTDVVTIESTLARDRRLNTVVREQSGLRIPGTVDPFELVVRAILGQQISVTGAKTLAARLAARYGTPLPSPRSSLRTSFPSPDLLVEAEVEGLGVTRSRAEAIRHVAGLVTSGELELVRGKRLSATYEQLLTIKGIGPWTASYVTLRALGDPDALVAGDLGVRQVLGSRAAPLSTAAVTRAAESWRPYRGYATVHIWTTLLKDTGRFA